MLLKLLYIILAVNASLGASMPMLTTKIKLITVFTSILASQLVTIPDPTPSMVASQLVTIPAPTPSMVASQLVTMPAPAAPSITYSKKEELMTELESYNEEIVSSELRKQREPKYLLNNLKKNLVPNRNKKVDPMKNIENAVNKILTLKAYLDEAERDLFLKNWDNLQVYLYTFADQEDSFAYLIDKLFPQSMSFTHSLTH
jgi:hypothetical protein